MEIYINMLITLQPMTIISISINDNILREAGRLEKELGFSGRSEIIRAGLRMLIADTKEKSKLKGKIDATLLVAHDDDYSEEASVIRHKYQELIKTQVHNHLESHKCLEIFVVNGDAERIKKLSEEFQANRKMDFVKLIVP